MHSSLNCFVNRFIELSIVSKFSPAIVYNSDTLLLSISSWCMIIENWNSNLYSIVFSMNRLIVSDYRMLDWWNKICKPLIKWYRNLSKLWHRMTLCILICIECSDWMKMAAFKVDMEHLGLKEIISWNSKQQHYLIRFYYE